MPDILLHICCGPCAIMPVIRLREWGFTPLLWFRNPNIQPLAEYMRRREAALQCVEKLRVAIIFEDEWDLPEWLNMQLPAANSPQRCENCVDERIKAAALKAKQLGIGQFSTSLLYSRYQPHEHMAISGENLAKRLNLRFFYYDFRTEWQAGIEVSREWGIYRQPYCGCVFSEAERYAKKFSRLREITTWRPAENFSENS